MLLNPSEGRPKKASSLAERYPVLNDDTGVDVEEEKSAFTELCAEMKNSKPSRDVFSLL